MTLGIASVTGLQGSHVYSSQPKRLRRWNRSTNPERIYVAEWMRRNRHRYISNGARLLDYILWPSDEDEMPPVSRRDAQVAASVIQWLGTNVGLGFLITCEEKIEKARATAEERLARPAMTELKRKQSEREYNHRLQRRRAVALGHDIGDSI